MTGASTGCGGGGWTLVMRIDGHKVWRNVPSLSYTGCIKKVDAFKFKLAITYCISLTTLLASN